MKLSNLLKPDYIKVNIDIRTKGDAIKEILKTFIENYDFAVDKDYLLNAIEEREKLGGTTFPTGISIPHARLDNFDDTLIGILVPQNPIKDGNIDIRMLVLILTSKTVSTVYLNTLATFIKVSKDNDIFSKILASASGQELVSVINKLDITVKKEITVTDIMSEDVISVSPKTTIKELADIFYVNKTGYVPVLDENGEFIGEVTLMILIEEGIPDYATQVGNLNFLKTFEPLERLFRKEDEITVGQIMKKPSIVFTRDTSIVEAALEFTKAQRRQIPIVEGKKVVGILALVDILDKILRS